ncbi:MAG: 16S rRNA (cytosine(1402)-N(4))-methyltransferase RsmH [Pseudomonadota bacterium]|nr:MAG: 16S rRNA methyltransferase [Pseudomonadota bacterium]
MLETPPSFHHVSVMVEEITRAFATAQGVVVDATAGGAGHTSALLAAHPGISLLAFDRDPRAVEAARHRLRPFGARARVEQAVFSEIPERLEALGIGSLGGVLADLGVSSEQLADAERGMSFRLEGPLDMRMDPTRGETALELIARLSQDELADVIYELGEERASRRIARCIKQALASGELETTLDLRRAVVRAVGPRRIGGVDPATRTFQALRMKVNGELEELRSLLAFARVRLAPGGIAAIISFHSLEDRLVKREFSQRDLWERITPKPLTASAEELERNPRSRSAKLRVARRRAPVRPEGADAT